MVVIGGGDSGGQITADLAYAPAHLPQEQSQRPGHVPSATDVDFSLYFFGDYPEDTAHDTYTSTPPSWPPHSPPGPAGSG